MEPPYKNWFVDIENRLCNLENGTIKNFETEPIDFLKEWNLNISE